MLKFEHNSMTAIQKLGQLAFVTQFQLTSIQLNKTIFDVDKYLLLYEINKSIKIVYHIENNSNEFELTDIYLWFNKHEKLGSLTSYFIMKLK